MIKLEKVNKTFNDHKALSNLSLNVKSGEIYGLLGANGAGKSTTLNLILGFLKPDKGLISVSDGSSNSKISSDMIGYIPENVNLYPYLTGVENLDYFCKLSGLKYNNIELLDNKEKLGLDYYNEIKLITDEHYYILLGINKPPLLASPPPACCEIVWKKTTLFLAATGTISGKERKQPMSKLNQQPVRFEVFI